MTNREMLLFAAAILFASTTLGLAFNALRPWHGMGPRPFHAMEGGPKGDWKKRGEEMFLKADADKDGALTKEEMLSGVSAKVEAMFAKLDANQDGKVTREEAEAGRKAMKKRFMENPDRGPDANNARRLVFRMPA